MTQKIMTLREYINRASEEKKAIGHFNITNSEMLSGIKKKKKEKNAPVIIGVSEGERDHMGIAQAVALVKSYRKGGTSSVDSAQGQEFPIFINADHTYSYERVKEAIDAGFDAVIFDATEMPFEKNVEETQKCVRYARAHTEATGHDVLVEAELGFIGKSSKVLAEVPAGVKITEEFLTKPEEATRFVELTGVDLLAPAVGNIHGMLKGGKDPALNTKRIAEIRAVSGVPLVLHGGSGGSTEDFLGAVKGGCAIVHISTEIRVAYRTALEKAFKDAPDEVAPYRYSAPAIEAVKKVVLEKLTLFGW